MLEKNPLSPAPTKKLNDDFLPPLIVVTESKVQKTKTVEK